MYSETSLMKWQTLVPGSLAHKHRKNKTEVDSV